MFRVLFRTIFKTFSTIAVVFLTFVVCVIVAMFVTAGNGQKPYNYCYPSSPTHNSEYCKSLKS